VSLRRVAHLVEVSGSLQIEMDGHNGCPTTLAASSGTA